jgi:poly(3-hydroxybutyrate) depolymerase
MSRITTVFLAALAGLLLLVTGPALADGQRTGSFVFSDWDGPPLRVFFAEPDAPSMDGAPVVFVLHGVNRNADDYARNWEALARTYGLRIYAPEFTSEAFPGAAMYNLGGLGTEGPYAFAVFEPLFEAVAERGGDAQGYHLFGHSAGAQVVHRAVLMEDLPRLITAYAANAGWYTLPHAEPVWPYGLGGTEIGEAELRGWLEAPMMLLLGDQDIDPEHENLRRTPEAMAQGPHRYARGAYFAAVGRASAREIGARFTWQVASVPGVAHDNAGMAEAAAAIIARHPDGFPANP